MWAMLTSNSCQLMSYLKVVQAVQGGYSELFQNWYINTFYNSASIYRKFNPGHRTTFRAIWPEKLSKEGKKRRIALELNCSYKIFL